MPCGPGSLHQRIVCLLSTWSTPWLSTCLNWCCLTTLLDPLALNPEAVCSSKAPLRHPIRMLGSLSVLPEDWVGTGCDPISASWEKSRQTGFLNFLFSLSTVCFNLFFEHWVSFWRTTLQTPISFKFAQRHPSSPLVTCLSSPSCWAGQTVFSPLTAKLSKKRFS